MTDCIVALVTVGTREEGERIADALVPESVAACVNIVGPIRSIYHWQGTLHHDEELLLIIKTRRELFDRLAARVRALHSYDNPEVVALPIVAGAEEYLGWVRVTTSREPG